MRVKDLFCTPTEDCNTLINLLNQVSAKIPGFKFKSLITNGIF